MNKVISVMAAATLGAGLMAMSPGAQAKPALPDADALAASVPNAEYTQHRGRRHGHYRSHRGRDAAAAAAAVGVAGALIGGAIAAQQRRDYYYDRPYGAYGHYGPDYDYYDPY
ncbi:hypothetical protein [Enterovirga aerilata]|uniref:Transmembrane protein n=1 Tax=Enterovirga aerilata TaxID=2730920 RepID=A0A849I1R9_9HYPH|nr:hypothetical protein [Enterovirga sp. DB1703]NNM71544.1 hypothetical protein [Enterovirga sp. DB1703]